MFLQSVLQQLTFKAIEMDKLLRYPSEELPFIDIIANEAWKEDDVFTMQRLAGLNTMSLRKMTNEGEKISQST
jgi:hypothetical protein